MIDQAFLTAIQNPIILISAIALAGVLISWSIVSTNNNNVRQWQTQATSTTERLHSKEDQLLKATETIGELRLIGQTLANTLNDVRDQLKECMDGKSTEE